ncbi:MAG: HEAT repeat domain-containing protein [Planctomycetes bacterium]|nr:HEAT repeat domain-containing protein [Planctomycetota bacterium]
MSPELAKIVKMLEGGSAELRCAAAMVIGELRPDEPAARKALLAALKSDNDSVRLYAVEALGRIDPRQAAPHLVPFLAGSPNLRARVQQILSGLGEEIVPLLRKQIDKAAPRLRSGILEVLGQFKTVDLSDTLFDSLGDPDPEVVRQAGAALRSRFEGLPAGDRDKAARQVMAFLASPKARKSPIASMTGLQILQSLKSPSAIRTYLELADPKREAGVRSTALAALADADLSGEESRVVRKLLPLLEEEDQAHVVSPALQALAKLEVGKDEAERVFKLLRSQHPAVRLFAVRSLGTLGGARAAEGLIEGLFSPDARIAEEAAVALRGNAGFAPAVLRALDREKDVNRAWKLANLLRGYRDVLDAAALKSFLKRCLSLHEKREGPFQVYFEVLRGAAPAVLRDALVQRGREMLRKKKWEDADRTMRLLEREDLATGESDYVLAVAMLKTLRKDLALASRDRSKSAFLFGKLVRRGEYPVLKALERDVAVLAAQDLLYLGFVLIERTGAERDLGAGVLRVLVKKFGRSKEAQTAKAKLKTQGL